MTLDQCAYYLTQGNQFALKALEHMSAEDAAELLDLMDLPNAEWRIREIWAKYGIVR